jgi:dihydroorotate dehydrogenase
MTLYSHLALPLIFRLEPERAHGIAMGGLMLAGKVPLGLRLLSACVSYYDARLETEVLGMSFRNPVGLAAGYDKDATAIPELAAMGFGHIEVGTVSPLPQAGNPSPRIFRLPEDQAVINRMGFPNGGADAMLARLRRARERGVRAPVGVSIGKGLDTPLESAVRDYSRLLRELHPYADYFAVNVSSPNTPGLRGLQAKVALLELLGELAQVREAVCPGTPLLVKIAPDLSFREVDDVLDVIISCGVDGVIATNTTVGRDGLNGRRSLWSMSGGLSGAPLRGTATEIIRHIYRQTQGCLPIIGVGGVDSANTALEKIQAGASLVQVYTGLIYKGPGLVKLINRGLARKLDEFGVGNLAQLVGTSGRWGRRQRTYVPGPVPLPVPARVGSANDAAIY